MQKIRKINEPILRKRRYRRTDGRTGRAEFIGPSHCVKSVRIRSYSGPYGVSLRIQSECGKTRTRITPNTDTFHAVSSWAGASINLLFKSSTKIKRHNYYD